MRMWNVDPKKMCIKHILGEHLEMHMFLGSIKKKRSIKGFIQKGLVEVHNIISRHDEISKELFNRTKNKHKTNFSEEDTRLLWNEGCVDSNLSESTLYERCNQCRYLMDSINK